jgi:hypothetical protein
MLALIHQPDVVRNTTAASACLQHESGASSQNKKAKSRLKIFSRVIFVLLLKWS